MAVIEAIATTYLESTQASVTFSSIPQTYEHLQLRISARGNISGSAGHPMYMRINGDTGSNYSNHTMQTYGGSYLNADPYVNYAYVYQAGRVVMPNSNAAYYAATIIDILDYRNTNKNTTMIGFTESLSASEYISFYSVLWDDTAAVTSILLYPPSSASFVADTTMTLYGLNSAN